MLYTDGVTDAPGELAVTVEEFADTISGAGRGPRVARAEVAMWDADGERSPFEETPGAA